MASTNFDSAVHPIKAPYIDDDTDVQTFLNATITDASNTVTAKFLATTSGATPDVNVSAGPPPAIGNVLVATSATTATWQASAPVATNATNANALNTTTLPVNVSLSAAPIGAGKILVSTSNTTATWQTPATPATSTSTNSLNTTTLPVVVSASAAPTAGQVLVATSATNATWQAPPPAVSLATTTLPVNVAASAAPTAGQVLVATSATNATWQAPPAAATLGHGFFYGTSPGDYAATIAVNAPFPIPTTDYTIGSVSSTRPDTFGVAVTAAGRYTVDFVSSCDEAGQVAIRVSAGGVGAFTTVNKTRCGRATGTNLFHISTSLSLGLNDVIRVYNDQSGAALTVTPNAGGTQSVPTTLRITRIV